MEYLSFTVDSYEDEELVPVENSETGETTEFRRSIVTVLNALVVAQEQCKREGKVGRFNIEYVSGDDKKVIELRIEADGNITRIED